MWAVDQKWIISHVFFEAFDEKIEDSNLVTYLRLKQVSSAVGCKFNFYVVFICLNFWYCFGIIIMYMNNANVLFIITNAVQ